jgi:putative membrane protein
VLLAQALFLFLYRRRIVFTAEKAKLYSRKRKKKEDGVMSTKSMRILNVAAGVLLIAAGIYCLCNQDVALLSAGLLLGIFLLLSGVAEIVVFAAASGVMLGSGWLLLDGILTVIMSLFLLFNQWFTMLSLPFLFTLWLLFSGVSQCVSSFDLRALGVRAWGWILAVGILLTLAGFICLMDPWVSVAAMGMTVGIVFLLEGVSSIVYACISRTKDI